MRCSSSAEGLQFLQIPQKVPTPFLALAILGNRAGYSRGFGFRASIDELTPAGGLRFSFGYQQIWRRFAPVVFLILAQAAFGAAHNSHDTSGTPWTGRPGISETLGKIQQRETHGHSHEIKEKKKHADDGGDPHAARTRDPAGGVSRAPQPARARGAETDDGRARLTCDGGPPRRRAAPQPPPASRG
jgi:hypothetical protein